MKKLKKIIVILFLQDNTGVLRYTVSVAKIGELNFELVELPPYSRFSPDLFRNLKKWLSGLRFSSNQEIITHRNAYFAGLPQSYFSKSSK